MVIFMGFLKTAGGSTEFMSEWVKNMWNQVPPEIKKTGRKTALEFLPLDNVTWLLNESHQQLLFSASQVGKLANLLLTRLRVLACFAYAFFHGGVVQAASPKPLQQHSQIQQQLFPTQQQLMIPPQQQTLVPRYEDIQLLPTQQQTLAPTFESHLLSIPVQQQVSAPCYEDISIAVQQQIQVPHYEDISIPVQQQIQAPHYEDISIPVQQQILAPHYEDITITPQQPIAIQMQQQTQVPYYEDISNPPQKQSPAPQYDNISIPVEQPASHIIIDSPFIAPRQQPDMFDWDITSEYLDALLEAFEAGEAC
jgi:hypothetical protein